MNAIVKFQEPRLPYHSAVGDRFGVDASGWKALVEAVWPAAKSPDSVVLALSYCKTRKLDPFKKPVHIVPMWDSKKKDYVETIWPGIAELRTTAFRTGQYAGCDEAVFGPLATRTFNGRVKARDGWEERSVTVEFPEWCRITVYRELNGRVCKFVGPKVNWIGSYATIGNSDLPNDMWQNRAEEQLEKCAEAAALRRAFPEEIGNQYAAEEMEGRRIHGDDAPTPHKPAPKPPNPDDEIIDVTDQNSLPAPNPPTGGEQGGASEVDAPPNSQAVEPEPEIDMTSILQKLEEDLSACNTEDAIAEAYYGTDVDAVLAATESGVELARQVRERHVDRVRAIAAKREENAHKAAAKKPKAEAKSMDEPPAEKSPKEVYCDEAIAAARKIMAEGGDFDDVKRKVWLKGGERRQELEMSDSEVLALRTRITAIGNGEDSGA